jgi:hypothetical protein
MKHGVAWEWTSTLNGAGVNGGHSVMGAGSTKVTDVTKILCFRRQKLILEW